MRLTDEEKMCLKLFAYAMALVVTVYAAFLISPLIYRAVEPILIGDKPAGREEWSK